MMAKMFYTLDETKSALGRNEEEIKQLAREGRLREFRDGPRLMFKADQVEALKRELGGGGDQVDLGPSDSGSPIGLADSRGASGTSISLADSEGGRSPGAGMHMKEDTALAADLGLSGSLGGIPSPGRSGAGGSVGGSGVTVFAPGEVEKVDPMAQTSISSGLQDQVNLEGVGSGSGLLDLTRESDDTSLGAELLDEIQPGKGARRPAGGSAAGGSGIGTGTMAAMSSAEPSGRVIMQPTIVEAADPMAPAFGGMALAAAAVVLFGGFITVSGVLGYYPQFLRDMKDSAPMFILGGGAGLAVLGFILGMLFGKMTTR